MERKDINEVTATEVLNLAAALLWDGISRPIKTDRFCCLAVSSAIEQITGLSWSDADDTELAVKLRKSILDRLDGHYTVEGFMMAQRGLGLGNIPSVEAQAFRKVLLGKLADELGVLNEQIRILEAVKVMRTIGRDFSRFVCWNVDAVLEDQTTPAGSKIKDDIDRYIGWNLTVRKMMELRDGFEYETDDPRVEAERLEMIDILLARYRAKLVA